MSIEGASQQYIYYLQITCKLGSGVSEPRAWWCFAKGLCSAHSVPSHKQGLEEVEEFVREAIPSPLCSSDNFCWGEREWKGR